MFTAGTHFVMAFKTCVAKVRLDGVIFLANTDMKAMGDKSLDVIPHTVPALVTLTCVVGNGLWGPVVAGFTAGGRSVVSWLAAVTDGCRTVAGPLPQLSLAA